jgi:hypothetical protein
MPDPSPIGGAAGDSFGAVFGLVAFLAVAVFVGIVALTIYRARRIAKAGHNPLTVETDIALKLLDSDALASTAAHGNAPSTTATDDVAAKLARLESLHSQGLISPDELAKARAAALAE